MSLISQVLNKIACYAKKKWDESNRNYWMDGFEETIREMEERLKTHRALVNCAREDLKPNLKLSVDAEELIAMIKEREKILQQLNFPTPFGCVTNEEDVRHLLETADKYTRRINQIAHIEKRGEPDAPITHPTYH